jgi:predicted DNA-binding transcriptional regulator AlpA
MKIIDKEFYSRDELAELIGCSVRHVDTMRKRMLLPETVRLGHLVKWTGVSIRRWVESGCPARTCNGEVN